MGEDKSGKTAPPEPKTDGLSVELLADGARKSCANAEALFSEAVLLSEHGALARSLCLHQISLEECAKVEHLGAWAMGLLQGEAIDSRRIRKTFGSHAAKNKLNAYMLDPSEDEIAAREKGDWKGAMEAFRETQRGFHQFSNDNKNAALYVDWSGSAFVAPADVIKQEGVAGIAALNARFLDYARLQIRMFDRLLESGDVLVPLLQALMEKMESLRDTPVEERLEGADTATADFLKAALAQARKT